MPPFSNDLPRVVFVGVADLPTLLAAVAAKDVRLGTVVVYLDDGGQAVVTRDLATGDFVLSPSGDNWFWTATDLTASVGRALAFFPPNYEIATGPSATPGGILARVRPAAGGFLGLAHAGLGPVYAVAGAAFAADQKLTSDGFGRLVPAASGDIVWAVSLAAAPGADTLAPVLYAPGAVP